MSKHAPKNMAASVHQRLMNLAKESGRTPNSRTGQVLDRTPPSWLPLLSTLI